MISERRITNSRVVLAVVAVAAVLLAGAWIRAALLMAHVGFDLTDEGYYILSYRWWNVNHRTYTGTQYLYGPVFQAFGWDIAKLRIFRTFTLVSSHVLFGLAFMQWLRLRRPKAPKSWLWEVIGTALVVAAAGMQCAWLPLSPGYNDVAMIGGALATAFALRVATLTERGRQAPIWLLMAFGPVVVTMAFAKWSSAVTVLFPTMLVVAAVVSARGWREVARTFVFVAAGTLAFALVLEIFVVRFERVLPQMAEVNRLLVKTGNSPKALLTMYWDSTLVIVKRAVEQYELLLIAAAVAVVSRVREAQIVAGLLAYVALDRAVMKLEANRGLIGGASNLKNYPVTITVIALTALVMIVTAHLASLVTRFTRTRRPSFVRDSLRGWLVFALVALFPIAHGFGTGNPIAFMIVSGFSGWMAIILAIATGFDGESRVARWFGYALAGGAALASVLIAKTGLLEDPYRTHSYEASTIVARDVPALRGIRLRPDVASQWAGLRATLKPHVEPEARAIAAYDELAGIVFILDGRPVGEAWTSALDHERSAEGFRSTCREGQPWWSERRPIVVFRRAVTALETRSFKECGIDFGTEYRPLAPNGPLMGLQIYVPTQE